MPRKRKIEPEEKIRIVQQCLYEANGVCEAAQQIGVDHKSVCEWISRYEAEGVDGLLSHEKNRVYSSELKMAAVIDYLSGKGSLQEICKKYKIRTKYSLRQWIKVYNAHGDFNSVKQSGGGSYMRQTRSTTQEERIQIARECVASGKNYGELAIKYNVSYQQVYIWTNKYAEQGEAGLEDRRGKRTAQQQPRTPEEEMKIRIAQLEHELYMTKMERDLLKKLDEIERRRG